MFLSMFFVFFCIIISTIEIQRIFLLLYFLCILEQKYVLLHLVHSCIYTSGLYLYFSSKQCSKQRKVCFLQNLKRKRKYLH